MYLDELAIRVVATLLIERRLRRSGADHGVRRLAEDRADASGGYDNGVGRERAHFHSPQIHRTNAPAGAGSVEHGREKFPVLVFLYFSFGFITTHLFIEGVEQLLSSCCAGECCSVEQCAAESAKVEQPFGSPIEGHSHTVE